MVIDVRRVVAPELAAAYEIVDVRMHHLRVLYIRSRNVVSDYGLLNIAAPFLPGMDRSGLTVLVEGRGRFEEAGVRRFLAPGDLVLSDQRRCGTEAYAGSDCALVAVDWEPGAYGPALGRSFGVERLSRRELRRVGTAAASFAAAATGRD